MIVHVLKNVLHETLGRLKGRVRKVAMENNNTARSGDVEHKYLEKS
jgi:hypothetical protein